MTFATVEARIQTLLKALSDFKDSYTASTIAFTQATRKISDSGSGLGFLEAGDTITVSGSVSNNRTFTVETAAAGEIVVTEALTTEAASNPVTIAAPEHVTLGDYRVIEHNPHAGAVILPGSFADDAAANYTIRHSWDVLLDLFSRYTTDEASWAAFVALRDAVVGQLEIYPTLNALDRVSLVSIAADGDPTEIYDSTGGGPYFLSQRLRLRVTERVDLAGGEYT